MHKDDFRIIMEKIKGAYGNKFQELTASMLTVWYDCLSDLDGEQLLKATGNYIKEKKYPPTIADLREEYRETRISKPIEESEEENPFERFQSLPQEVFEEFRRIGIIDEEGCIECLNATEEQIKNLQECGAL